MADKEEQQGLLNLTSYWRDLIKLIYIIQIYRKQTLKFIDCELAAIIKEHEEKRYQKQSEAI